MILRSFDSILTITPFAFWLILSYMLRDEVPSRAAIFVTQSCSGELTSGVTGLIKFS